jgi:hypothetical protein
MSDFGSAGSEARALFQMVAVGRMTPAEARDLIAIPPNVCALFKAAAEWDSSLAPLCLGAIEWRERVAARFESLLAHTPVNSVELKAGKTIQRSGKRSVRLPIAREMLIPANTAAQDERSQVISR